MRIELDENVPTPLVADLAEFGHQTETVAGERLKGAADDIVWQAAQSEERLLITQDLHFSDIRTYPPGSHAGILLLRLRRPGWAVLRSRMRALLEEEDFDDWSGCLVVATEGKVRVRRPEDEG